ncbi:MAG: hypothetical protein HOH33_09270 [Verrucomicrobia bacterium]|nr:hypothetical protein [Verrucomicrobiota bacterium]
MKATFNAANLRQMHAVWAFMLMIGSVAVPKVHACKYSVRDVAFVDLTQESYAFITIGNASEIDGLKTRIQPVATAVFLDSNIRTAWLSADEAAAHPNFESIQSGVIPSGSFLFRDGLEPLSLVNSDEITNADSGAIWKHLEKAVHSPVRQEAANHLLSAYAVILIVEGTDEKENVRVRMAARSAADAIASMIPEMPKPVDVPPQVVVVANHQIESEMAMLWGLGMEHHQPEYPQAAVLIGRGRRLGPTLQSDEITSSKLQQILAVAGQDCECELDRSWMQGPMIPLRWGPDRQQTTYNALGFDPDNPLVKAEISRILARGKNPIRVNDAEGIGTELDMLLLGYSEEVIGFEELTIEPAMDTSESVEHESPVLNSSNSPSDHESTGLETHSDTSFVEAGSNIEPNDSQDDNEPVQKGEPAPRSMRKMLVLLAGFCVLALLGGISVLLIGRGRN